MNEMRGDATPGMSLGSAACDGAQPSTAVSSAPSRSSNSDQVSSLTDLAGTAPSAYRRDLPHLQNPGQTFAITFATWKRYPLPERVRQLVLDCCTHSAGVRFEMHAA